MIIPNTNWLSFVGILLLPDLQLNSESKLEVKGRRKRIFLTRNNLINFILVSVIIAQTYIALGYIVLYEPE